MKTSYDISSQPSGCIEWRDDYGIKHWANFSMTTDEWALAQGFKHEVVFNKDNVRFANVLKTVVHVATDEDVVTSWKIKATFH